jgi:hypothetical protein
MAKKNIKLTTHSNIRINERVSASDFNIMDKKKLWRNALKNGIYYEAYKNLDKNSHFRTYLNNKNRPNSRLILYKRYVFITTKDCKTLITVYPVPEEYHKIYDSFIGDVGLSKPYVVYFKDRNTNKFKPILNFKNEKIAQDFVFDILYPNVTQRSKMQEYLKIAHNKKRYKIEKVNKLPLNMPNKFALRF